LAAEKENHVAGAMRAMGLHDGAYWAANWLQAVLSSIVTAAIATVMCEAIGFLKDFKRDVLYVVILVYLLALYSLAFFLSSLVSRVRSALMASVFLLILNAMLAGFYLYPEVNPLVYMWWEKPFPKPVREFFEFFMPAFNLLKIYVDGARSTPDTLATNYSTGETYEVKAAPLGFDDFNFSINCSECGMLWNPGYPEYHPADWQGLITPPTRNALALLGWSALLLWALAWYCTQVVTGDDAQPQPPWFFLLPSYWIPALRSTKRLDALRARLSALPEDQSLDEDVRAEAAAVHSGKLPADAKVVLLQLVKRFGGRVKRGEALMCRVVVFAGVMGVVIGSVVGSQPDSTAVDGLVAWVVGTIVGLVLAGGLAGVLVGCSCCRCCGFVWQKASCMLPLLSLACSAHSPTCFFFPQGVTAVRGISLAMQPGACFALLGHNGAVSRKRAPTPET
jgi:hypothetical protein